MRAPPRRSLSLVYFRGEAAIAMANLWIQVKSRRGVYSSDSRSILGQKPSPSLVFPMHSLSPSASDLEARPTPDIKELFSSTLFFAAQKRPVVRRLGVAVAVEWGFRRRGRGGLVQDGGRNGPLPVSGHSAPRQ